MQINAQQFKIPVLAGFWCKLPSDLKKTNSVLSPYQVRDDIYKHTKKENYGDN